MKQIRFFQPGPLWTVLFGLALGVGAGVGCSSSEADSPSTPSGGVGPLSTGGTASGGLISATGGVVATTGGGGLTGGAIATGGTTGGSVAGNASGGAASGGVGIGGASGGTPATGGVSSGGSLSGSGGASGKGGASVGGSSGSDGNAGRGGLSSGGSLGSGGSGGRDAAAGVAGTGGNGGRSGSGGVGGASVGGSATLPAMTIWIAGDSTVKTYAAGNTDGNNGTELEGWGQEIGQFFSSKVTINNQAIGGRSVAMFMWTVATDSAGTQLCVDDEGTPKFQLDSAGNKIDTSQWSRIKSGIKPGDFLMVQFGHNDETNTCPRHVTTADFETYLGFMADTAIAKGATVVFVTPMGHRSFTGTKFNNTLLPYANAMKDEASKKKIEIEDLNLRSGEYYESVGNNYLASKIFDGGTTHFIKPGAVKMAELIVGEIKKNNGPLAAYLK